MPDQLATPSIDPARLAQIARLSAGAHDGIEDGACAMEAVAFITGEPWSDHPKCASPVIGAFMRAWNDGLPDDERNALILPLIPRLVGTRGSAALEGRRALMAADWLVRTHTPAWLRLAGLTAQADMLSSLPEITAMAQVPSIRGSLEAVRMDVDAAWAAAWAAGGASGDAAWDAVAAVGAARAALDAAWDAAWNVAKAAAKAARAAAAAAGGTARAKLKPTKDALQRSALVLVEPMIDATEAE